MQKTKRLSLVRALTNSAGLPPGAPPAACHPAGGQPQPGNLEIPPEVLAKFTAKLNPQIAIVRFARKREAGLKRENRPLAPVRLEKDLNQIRRAFSQEPLFAGRADFVSLCRRALTFLSLLDWRQHARPGAHNPFTLPVGTWYWDSLCRYYAADGLPDYFAVLDEADLLLDFSRYNGPEAGSMDEKATLFYHIQDTLQALGYITSRPEDDQLFQLTPLALTKVLYQLCLYIHDFYGHNYPDYKFAVPLPCEIAYRVACDLKRGDKPHGP